MFEQYTERAKRVLAFAKYEASQMGSDVMQTEHLLLGLIREAEDIILKLFAKWNLDPEEVRAEVEMMSTFQKRKSAPVEISISREVQHVLSYAVEESKRLEHRYVGTEHILLGLLHEEESLAARILSQKGLRVWELREDIVAFHEQKAHAKRLDHRLDRLLEGERQAVEALRSLATDLSLGEPAYLFSPAELKTVHDAFSSLKEAPVELAVLAHRSGLVVSSRGNLPVTLASWIGGVLADERAALRVDEGSVFFETSQGRRIHLTWVTGGAFLLLLPREGANDGSIRQAAAAAAAVLGPVFKPPAGETPPSPKAEE